MKKLLCIALALALLFALAIPAAAANSTTNATITYRGVKIVVDGNAIVPCDAKGNAVEPFILNGTTYLPVRAVANALGLNVGWDNATSTVTLAAGGTVNYGSGSIPATNVSKVVTLTYRDIKLVIDGKTVTPTDAKGNAVEPFIIDGTTYLPVRAVSNALGLDVGWDDTASTVTLNAAKTQGKYVLVKEEGTSNGTQETWFPRTVTYTYDSKGNLIRYKIVIDWQTIIKTYAYDSAGKLTSTELSSSMGWWTTDAYKYDAKGLLIEENVDSTMVSPQLITYTYDANGNLLKENIKFLDGLPGRETTYTYSGGQLFSARTSYDGGAWDFTLYTCDPDGKLIKEESSDSYGYSSTTTYSYDAKGNCTSMKEVSDHGTTATAYAYDEHGNCISETLSDSTGYTSTVIYTYEYITLH